MALVCLTQGTWHRAVDIAGSNDMAEISRLSSKNGQPIHVEERVIAILNEHGAGAKTADLARKHNVSEATNYN
ncbi:hypothetical protein [Bradyrhizobium sp. CCBAU 21359]|uniref:hypothetical protein n=1 Tax=Bradyrhizobium sp. CCBAU 21359 TaxID=1325080 RepID=UPI003FA4B16A